MQVSRNLQKRTVENTMTTFLDDDAVFSCDTTLRAERGNSCENSRPARVRRSRWLAALWGVWNGAWSEHSRAARGRADRSLGAQRSVRHMVGPMLLSRLTAPTGGLLSGDGSGSSEQSVIVWRGRDFKGFLEKRLEGTERLVKDTTRNRKSVLVFQEENWPPKWHRQKKSDQVKGVCGWCWTPLKKSRVNLSFKKKNLTRYL